MMMMLMMMIIIIIIRDIEIMHQESRLPIL